MLLLDPVADLERGDTLAGRYQIEKVVGKGATGIVLQAFDRVVRERVAVKILKPELASDRRWLDRLGGELANARKLQHPHVCRVFDMAEADGHVFLTMELASGGALRESFAAGAPARPLDKRIAEARAIVDGMAALHAARVVHRDIKPENVLRMGDGRLVISDLGMAVRPDQTNYFSGPVGTPSYMAPEIAVGDVATMTSDVWSLGVTLHETLFGKRPEWDLSRRGRQLASPVAANGSAVEKALARLCGDCLIEQPGRRIPDAIELQRRFAQAARGRYWPLANRLRGMIGPILTAAVVLGFVTVVAIDRGGPEKKVDAEPVAPTGTAIDLRPVSRSLLVRNDRFRCLQALPGGRAVRVVTMGRPAEVLDVVVDTGQATPARLVPDSYQFGCPQLSPDGRSLLYAKATGDRRMQILLSPHPDGHDADVITQGTSPTWLPNGNEFVFEFDQRRAAVFSLPDQLRIFPDTPPAEKTIVDTAVSSGGDRVAVLYVDSAKKHSIEVHGLPSQELVQRVALQGVARGLTFDGANQRLLVIFPDPTWATLGEITPDKQLIRRANLHRTHIYDTVRVGTRLVVASHQNLFSVRVPEGGGGSEREIVAPGLYAQAVASSRGDVLMQETLEDGHNVILLHRAGAQGTEQLTQGPDDWTPIFDDRGTGFFYVRRSDDALLYCDRLSPASGSCHERHREALGFARLSLSPDGKLLAYFTRNAYRLRLLDLGTGRVSELGTIGGACLPRWTSGNRLWVNERTQRGALWTEMNPRQTPIEKIKRVEALGDTCEQVLDGVAPDPLRVRTVESRTAELFVSGAF